MITGNQNKSSDFLKVLLALKDNVMRSINCADVGEVISVKNGKYECRLLSDSKMIIECEKLFNLEVNISDVVLITFTKSDFRQNLVRIKQGQQIVDSVKDTLHSINYGIITGIIYKKETTT